MIPGITAPGRPSRPAALVVGEAREVHLRGLTNRRTVSSETSGCSSGSSSPSSTSSIRIVPQSCLIMRQSTVATGSPSASKKVIRLTMNTIVPERPVLA